MIHDGADRFVVNPQHPVDKCEHGNSASRCSRCREPGRTPTVIDRAAYVQIQEDRGGQDPIFARRKERKRLAKRSPFPRPRPDDYISQSEVCRLLGYSENSVKHIRTLDAQLQPTISPAGRRSYSRARVLAYVASLATAKESA